MSKPVRIKAAKEAAVLLEQAAEELRGTDDFRFHALFELSHCVAKLATKRAFELSFPRGDVTIMEADGFCVAQMELPEDRQPAGNTSGRIQVTAAAPSHAQAIRVEAE